MAILGRLDGWVEKGGQSVLAGGISSTSTVQLSYPSTTVTIYNAGTLVPATIFSDAASTAKANPFTADANGYWFFWAAPGDYDITFGSPASHTRASMRISSSAASTTINVKDYGAKGDGVTDDTAAIQAALNAVPTQVVGASVYLSRGAVVYLPRGSYIVSSTLIMPRGVELRGESSESTEIRYNQTTGDILYYQRPAVAMSVQPLIKIKGLRVTVATGVTHSSGAGIHVDSADAGVMSERIDFDDVQAFFANVGFNIRNIIQGHIKMCGAHFSVDRGFVFRGASTELLAENSWASGSGSHGWDISGVAYSSFLACGSDSNGGHGWLVKQQAGDGAMIGNRFQIGSEGSITSLATFDSLIATDVLMTGIAKISGGATIDGVVIINCVGLTITPYIGTSATATGFPFKLSGSTNTGITLNGGLIGTFAAGVNQFTGIATNALTIINLAGGMAVGGGVTNTAPTGAGQLSLVKRSGVPGTAGNVINDLRYIATDVLGSGMLRVGADNGSSWTELEHNSLGGGPYRYGTFGDAILRSSNGRVVLAAGSSLGLTADSTGTLTAPQQAVAPSTMTVVNSANLRSVVHRFDWTNAMVTALGAIAAGNIGICTIPAKTVVKNIWIVITGASTGTTTLTVSVGRAAGQIDYIVAKDAKAAANTIYGAVAGDRGTNLTGYDLASATAATNIFALFTSTGGNLSASLGSSGSIYVETMTLP